MPIFDTDIVQAAVDVAKNGTRTLVAAPGAGKALWIYGVMLHTNGGGTAKLQDSTPTAKTGTIPVAAYGGLFRPPRDNPQAEPYYKCAANTAFQVVLSANPDADGEIWYRTVQV